jgi:hypothetical protein
LNQKNAKKLPPHEISGDGVVGTLDADLARRLDGVNLSEEAACDNMPISVLVGRMVDQAALSGLLNSLYGLHLPLISVDCLAAEAERK